MQTWKKLDRDRFWFGSNLLRSYIRPILILCLIYIIGTSAITRANFYYIDDMGRARNGYIDWGTTMSRYVSAFLSQVIHTDSFLADISPLAQWIALLIMSVTAITVLYLLQGEKKINWIHLVAAIPLALSPYFLECLSYKYDAPYMALSVLAGVVPLLFRKENTVIYILVSIMGVLVVSMTYQAAWGIYPILVILLATKDWNQGEKLISVIKNIMVSVFSYGIALFVFKFFIMKTIDTYVTDDMFAIQDLFNGYWSNLKQYYMTVRNDYRPVWLILIGLVVVAYGWVFVRDSQRKKLAALAIVVVSLLLMGMLAFGLYPALIKPPMQPRSMYGFGVMISILGMAVCTSKRIHIGKAACIALSWYFVVLTFIYGNALSAQAEYTNYRVTMIAESLGELECVKSEQPVTVQIKGSIGYAASVPKQAIIRKLIPITLREKWWWGSYGLLYYYGLYNLRNYYPITDELILNNPVREVDHALYSIDVDGQNVVVTLK